MTQSDIVTWIGTIFSILGAAVSFVQARSAKSSASYAEEVRNDLKVKAQNSELGSLNGTINAAIRAMDKYGPGTSALARRGSSADSDASTVREFIVELERNREILSGLIKEKFVQFKSNIEQLLTEFGDESTEEGRTRKGKEIYVSLVEFSGIIKQIIDKNNFQS